MSTFDEYLERYVRYVPDTGHFYWKEKPANRCLLDVPFGTRNHDGYLRTTMCGKSVLLARLAWYVTHRRWPTPEVDHINRIRDDNRIVNLREVTHKENSGNTWKSSNKTGIANVYWCNRERKYLKYKKTAEGRKYVGRYDTIEEAANA